MKSRLSVLNTVYHQPAGEQPMAVVGNYCRWLESDEQPFSRRLRIGEEWQAIETGWIRHAGLVVLKNDEGVFDQVQPTEQERMDAQAKVLEVSCSSGPPEAQWLVRPGESLPATPASTMRLQIRCRQGQARCTVTAFPE